MLQDVTPHRRAADNLRAAHAAERRQAEAEWMRWHRERDEERAQWQRERVNRKANPISAVLLTRLAHALRPALGRMSATVRKLMLGEDVKSQVIDEMHLDLQPLTLLAEGIGVIAQLEQKDFALQRQPLELGKRIERAVASCCPLVRACGHHLTVSLPLGPQWLGGDPARIEQIIAILLDNAARYTPPGGEISLAAERVNEQVVLRVRNNGPALALENLSRLADVNAREERFWAGDNGPGIGLAVARTLAEEHGGAITIASNDLGEGTEATLFLPAPAPEPLAEAEYSWSESEADTEGAPGLLSTAAPLPNGAAPE
jgi:signal transduction histidine kinase